MRDYKGLMHQKVAMPDVTDIQKDISNASSWDEAYWIGKYVFEQASGAADKLIMDAYERAFGLGLNIRVNRECFLTATQQIARIYFQFRMYDKAINKLMVLDSNVDNLPDWVNLYYASAQIHTDNILYWAEVPSLLFKRIDGIDEKDTESVRRRKFLYLEFLNRLSEISKKKDISSVDKTAILDKAASLGVADSRECLTFKFAVGLLKELPNIAETPSNKPLASSNSIYEEMVAELNKKLAELQGIIDRQSRELVQKSVYVSDQEKQIAALRNDSEVRENAFAKQTEELKHAREGEYQLQAKYKALESQLSGSEEARRQLENDASIIGELQADVDDLKTALFVTKRNNEGLQTELQQSNETIGSLRNELLQNQKYIQELQAEIAEQKSKVEVAEAAVKSAEARVAETEAKMTDAIANAGTIVSSPSSGSSEVAKDVSQLTMLDILTVENFLPRKKKILIIGGSETKEAHLRGKLKGLGFNFSKDQLEFELEYSNVKDYTSRIVPWSGKYAGIIVGPCPHKAKDIDGYSSFIEQMKAEEGYPHVEEARDKAGNLKISNSSIGEAMMRMAVHLQSIA